MESLGLSLPLLPRYRWDDIIHIYARCALTNKSDKLLALSSFGVYLAGLWGNQLDDDLLCHDLLWKSSMIRGTSRATEYRAPSWAWASLDGQIEGGFSRGVSCGKIVAQVLNARTTPVTDSSRTFSDPFGAVTHGFLHIKGCLARSRFSEI